MAINFAVIGSFIRSDKVLPTIELYESIPLRHPILVFDYAHRFDYTVFLYSSHLTSNSNLRLFSVVL